MVGSIIKIWGSSKARGPLDLENGEILTMLLLFICVSLYLPASVVSCYSSLFSCFSRVVDGGRSCLPTQPPPTPVPRFCLLLQI